MACLDSSFVIDILRGKAEAISKKTALEKEGEILFISTPVIMELALGAHLSKRTGEEKQKILRLLSDAFVLNFDQESAFRAGEIEALLIKKKELIEAEDIMIAAIALQHNEPLVTRNARHFEKIKGLRVESY